MKTVACVIARTNSTRLPRKVLKKVFNKTMIEHIIDRLKLCKNIDKIYICTSITSEDSVLNEVAVNNDIDFYAGSEDSVIDRMMDVANIENADNLIRVTGDNIFTDSVYTDIMINYHNKFNFDYTRTEYLPVGITSEIISSEALKKIYDSIPANESQYLMMYAFQPGLYKCGVMIPPPIHQHKEWSFTVDNFDDWDRTVKVFDSIKRSLFSYSDLLAIDGIESFPAISFNPSTTVKLPAMLNIYFETYRCEMDLRIELSNKFDISLEEYLRNKNDQGL